MRFIVSGSCFGLFVVMLTAGCAGLPEGAEPLRPGDISGGGSAAQQPAAQQTDQKEEQQAKAEGQPQQTGEGLPEEFANVSCPKLGPPPEGLETAGEIREWGCQQLVGDKDQPGKYGDKALENMYKWCAETRMYKMYYSCWSAEGEQLARFGYPGEDGKFQTVTIFDEESASKWVDGATLVSRDQHARKCSVEFERGDTKYYLSDSDLDEKTDEIMVYTHDEQGRMLTRKTHRPATGKTRMNERREWDGNTFKEYTTYDEEKFTGIVQVDDEGRTTRRESPESGRVLEYDYDEKGRKIVERTDEDGDGKWEKVVKTTYKGDRAMRVERTTDGSTAVIVYEYGPKGLIKAVETAGGDKQIVAKATYDDQGRPVDTRELRANSMQITKHDWKEGNRVISESFNAFFKPEDAPKIDEMPEGASSREPRERWYGCFLD